MLRALMNLFRSEDPLAEIGREFSRMLSVAEDMTATAGRLFFGTEPDEAQKRRLYEIDVEVNQLERKIRKRLVTHLSLPGNERDVPHCLAMMSLVKDVERLGDYAKNLTEVSDLHSSPLPEDELTRELREIRTEVESNFKASAEAFSSFDPERAARLMQQGRALTKRCDALVIAISRSAHGAGTTAALVLGARYYKRIAAHLLNVLSAVVMPLHKLDYYDEDEITMGHDSD